MNDEDIVEEKMNEVYEDMAEEILSEKPTEEVIQPEKKVISEETLTSDDIKNIELLALQDLEAGNNIGHKFLTSREFIALPMSIHINPQMHIKNGEKLLELPHVQQDKFVKEDIEKKVEQAKILLRGGKIG